MSVGTRIAELRKAKSWTQAQLAKGAQLSASTIAMYETNRRLPDANALAKLAKALDVGIEQISDAQTERVLDEIAATTPRGEPMLGTRPTGGTPGVHTNAGESLNLTTFTLNREEARFILFMRMNPQCRSFLESYVMADEHKRQQLERTWRLIHDFQK